MSLSAMDIVKLFEEDVRARKKLAELLVSEPDVRLVIINAVLRDVATKSDLDRLRDELRNEFRREISRLESRIDSLSKDIVGLGEDTVGLRDRVIKLEERIYGLEKRVDMIFKFMVALNTPILVAVIGILLKIIMGV